MAKVLPPTSWGSYVPGRRIELHGDQRKGWYLIQYEPASPHPETWRSRRYGFPDAARRDRLRIRIVEEESGQKLLALPAIISMAIGRHTMLSHRGALRDLTCDCLSTTAEEVRAAAEELDTLKEMVPDWGRNTD